MSEKEKEKEKEDRIVGFDIGTMFCQMSEVSEGDDINVKIIRNAFVEMVEAEDVEEVLKRNNWQYVKDADKFYVIGEDSMQVARMFPGKVDIRRPLQHGVLNKDEPKKMLVLSEIIKSTLGEAPTEDSVLCTCISSECVDGGHDNTFHKARLRSMFTRFGWKVKIIEEGLAVILNERPTFTDSDGNEVPYSGLGCSWGAGKVNCVLAYKGLQIIGMSVQRSGDWIDEQVSGQTGVPISQVISKKEKDLDFNDIDYDDDVLFALDAYYEAAIKYVMKHLARKFSEVKSQFDAPLQMILAGGTSMPKGFDKKVERTVRNMDLPFEIASVHRAEMPRNSVTQGLLTQATITYNKLKKGKITEKDLD
jgi:hypothetical protein